MEPDRTTPCKNVNAEKKTNYTQIQTQVFVHPISGSIFMCSTIFFCNIYPLKIKQQSPTKSWPMEPDRTTPCKNVDDEKKTNYTNIDQNVFF